MPTAADVPAASSQAVSCWSLTRRRRSPCTSPMIPRPVARITRRELGRRTQRGPSSSRVPLLRAARQRHAHTRGRARERERRQRGGGERRERGQWTAASVWRCGDQGGCTGCLDDHRVMSVGAWRPAAAADDDPEAAFPAWRHERAGDSAASGFSSASSELAPRVRLLRMCRAPRYYGATSSSSSS